MPTPTQDINVDQGSTFIMQITLKDKVTTNPINITSYTFCGAVKQSVYDTDFLPFRFVKVDALNGILNVILDPKESKKLDFNTGMYDISFKLTDDSVTRILQGVVTVSLGGTEPC